MGILEYIRKNYNTVQISEEKIDQVIKGIKYFVQKNWTIYVCGNGGSGYTGSHFVQDLVKVHGVKAYSLNDNSGLVTAIANDSAYSSVFADQIAHIRDPFMLIAISCSGNSENVISAASLTRYKHNPVLSFTAYDGGLLARPNMSTLNINVGTNNIYVAESIHSLILHYVIDELK